MRALAALLVAALALASCADDEAILYEAEPQPYHCALTECCDLVSETAADRLVSEAVDYIDCLTISDACELPEGTEELWSCADVAGIQDAELRAALIGALVSEP